MSQTVLSFSFIFLVKRNFAFSHFQIYWLMSTPFHHCFGWTCLVVSSYVFLTLIVGKLCFDPCTLQVSTTPPYFFLNMYTPKLLSETNQTRQHSQEEFFEKWPQWEINLVKELNLIVKHVKGDSQVEHFVTKGTFQLTTQRKTCSGNTRSMPRNRKVKSYLSKMPWSF